MRCARQNVDSLRIPNSLDQNWTPKIFSKPGALRAPGCAKTYGFILVFAIKYPKSFPARFARREVENIRFDKGFQHKIL